MTNEQTIEKLYDLKLGAMAEAFREMLSRPDQGSSSPLPSASGSWSIRNGCRREENRLDPAPEGRPPARCRRAWRRSTSHSPRA